MKISYNWLKQYLDFDLSPKDLSDILTSIGLEVEGMEDFVSVPGGLEGLVIGYVKETHPHPNADKLKLTKVDVGIGTDLSIVCGAPNVAAGQKVVVALIGTTVHPVKGEPFQIKKAKIRGEESQGMICAEDEIGLGESHEGVMVLGNDAVVGTKAADYMKIEKDTILEIGLTPNRSDAQSHFGVARDLAAYLAINKNFSGKLTLPSIDSFRSDDKSLPIEVVIENIEACPRYSGITISGIEVKESPDWLKARLKSVGVRSINNVVDITNFILHELGQPLHAFDADEIAGRKVVVKTLAAGTKFKTLDEQERTLGENDLMICNTVEGMCIAGVFGGAKSGVKNSTKNIFIESAYFNPKYIRHTSRSLGLKTDASSRYEKGCDPEITVYALKRAAMLVKEVAGGKISSEIVDVYPAKVERPLIEVKYAHIDRLIGKKIDHYIIHDIIHALDMLIIDKVENHFKVSVPVYRTDVIREVDIIEEVLRIYGLNNVEMPEQLRTSMVFAEKPDPEIIQNTISDLLSSNGFYELFNNSISRSKYLKDSFPEESATAIHLLNSLNADLDILRTNMVVSGLEAIAYNINRRKSDLKFYEFGKVYYKEGERYSESQRLSLFLCGMKGEENWKQKQQPSDFFLLKAYVEQILSRTGISGLTSQPVQHKWLAHGLEYLAGKKTIVRFGPLSKVVLNNFDIELPVFFAELEWANVLQKVKRHKIEFKELPKFPGTRRDLALVVNKSINFGAVKEIAAKSGGPLLRGVNLFDIYESAEKIGTDKKSFAVSFDFMDMEKTLSDKDVDKVMDKLISEYENQLEASIRK